MVARPCTGGPLWPHLRSIELRLRDEGRPQRAARTDPLAVFSECDYYSPGNPALAHFIKDFVYGFERTRLDCAPQLACGSQVEHLPKVLSCPGCCRTDLDFTHHYCRKAQVFGGHPNDNQPSRGSHCVECLVVGLFRAGCDHRNMSTAQFSNRFYRVFLRCVEGSRGPERAREVELVV